MSNPFFERYGKVVPKPTKEVISQPKPSPPKTVAPSPVPKPSPAPKPKPVSKPSPSPAPKVEPPKTTPIPSKQEKQVALVETLPPNSVIKKVVSEDIKQTIDKDVYSQKQYTEKLELEKQIALSKVKKQQSEIASIQKTISPSETYISGGRERKGVDVLNEIRGYSEELKSTRDDISKSYESSKQSVMDLPSGSRIVKSDNGFMVRVPDSARLDFTKNVLEDIENFNPVIAGINKARFGFESAFLALSAPVTNIFGKEATALTVKGAQFMSLGIPGMAADLYTGRDLSKTYLKSSKYTTPHFSSVWDIAFEPIGWSPKGSTKLFASDPYFYAGGIGGEVGQFVLSGAGAGLIKSGVTTGTKGVVKRLPVFYSKFSKVFPEEKFVGKAGSKVASTSFGKNLYGWSAKGWKPGKELVFRSAGEPVKKGFTTIQKGKYSPLRSLKQPFGKRIWLSGDDVARYQSKIASSGVIDIPFPRSKTTSGVGKVIGTADTTIWKPGRSVLKKTYMFSRGEKSIGVQAGSLYDDLAKPGLGSYYRDKGVVGTVLDVGSTRSPKSAWFETVKSSYKSGYPYRFSTLESGKQIVDFTKGFGRGVSPPTPKPWISKVKYGFVKSREATASLLQQSRSVFKNPSRTSSILRTGMLKYPSRGISGNVFGSLGFLGSKSVVGSVKTPNVGFIPTEKTISVPKVKQVYRSISKTSNVSGFSRSSINANVLRQPMATTTVVTPILKTRQMFDVMQDTIITPRFKQVSKQDYKFIFRPPAASKSKLGLMPFIPPKLGLYGRGGMQYGFGGLSSKYRFREFKIGSPLKGVKL